MDIQKLFQNFYLENSNVDKAKFDKKLIGTKFEIKGVKTSVIEKFVKTLRSYKVDVEKLPVCFHEDVLIKGFLIAKESNSEEKIKQLLNILPFINNWATCDMIASRLKNMSSYRPFFENLLLSDKPFVVRFAVVYLKSLLKFDCENILLKIVKVDFDNYYVKMAQAWVIADALVIDFYLTKNILNEIEDDFVKNKAISKACDSYRLNSVQKEELKAFRVKKEKQC